MKDPVLNLWIGLMIGVLAVGGVGLLLLAFHERITMNFQMPEVVGRIFGDKIVWIAIATIAANAIAAAGGADLHGPFMQIVDYAFAGVAGKQIVHTAIHGSVSDGTAKIRTESKETVTVATETTEPAPGFKL